MHRLHPAAIAALGSILIALSIVASAEQPRGANMHRVVIEITADGQEQWSGVLNNAENVRKALGTDRTEVEVVVHGSAMGMLLARERDSEFGKRLASLAEVGVVFSACQNTMNRKKLKREDLLDAASVVDSGVAQVVRRQEAGWAYIKAGN